MAEPNCIRRSTSGVTVRSGASFTRRGIALGLAASAAACAPAPEVRFNYRLRIAVSIDGEERVGETVNRVVWRDMHGRPFAGGRFVPRVWGEATVIDMGGQHGPLFATLSNARTRQFSPSATISSLLLDAPSSSSNDEIFEALKRVPNLRQVVTAPRANWPLFVRFRNLRDPATVEEVEPDKIGDLYGVPAAISSVTMQITDERPTVRIAKVLPWVSSLDTNLAGTKLQAVRGPVANQIGQFDFWMRGT